MLLSDTFKVTRSVLYDHCILDEEEILACFLELNREKIQENHTYIFRIHSRE